MKATKVTASLRNYRRSASKVREVANVIRGAMVSEAEVKLSGISKHSSEDILKLLKSAVANAENNHKLDKKDLYISKITVDEGAVLKRWRARAYGRAAQILKRSCHINIVLEPVKKEDDKEIKDIELSKDESGRKINAKSIDKKIEKKTESSKDEKSISAKATASKKSVVKKTDK